MRNFDTDLNNNNFIDGTGTQHLNTNNDSNVVAKAEDKQLLPPFSKPFDENFNETLQYIQFSDDITNNITATLTSSKLSTSKSNKFQSSSSNTNANTLTLNNKMFLQSETKLDIRAALSPEMGGLMNIFKTGDVHIIDNNSSHYGINESGNGSKANIATDINTDDENQGEQALKQTYEGRKSDYLTSQPPMPFSPRTSFDEDLAQFNNKKSTLQSTNTEQVLPNFLMFSDAMDNERDHKQNHPINQYVFDDSNAVQQYPYLNNSHLHNSQQQNSTVTPPFGPPPYYHHSKNHTLHQTIPSNFCRQRRVSHNHLPTPLNPHEREHLNYDHLHHNYSTYRYATNSSSPHNNSHDSLQYSYSHHDCLRHSSSVHTTFNSIPTNSPRNNRSLIEPISENSSSYTSAHSNNDLLGSSTTSLSIVRINSVPKLESLGSLLLPPGSSTSIDLPNDDCFADANSLVISPPQKSVSSITTRTSPNLDVTFLRYCYNTLEPISNLQNNSKMDCNKSNLNIPTLFSCPNCDRKFHSLSNLTSHSRCHLSENLMIKCSLCPLKFKRKNDLIRHYESNHLKFKILCCGEYNDLPWGCKMKYSRRDALVKHWNGRGLHCLLQFRRLLGDVDNNLSLKDLRRLALENVFQINDI